GADLLGGRHAGRGGAGRAEPGDRGPGRRTSAADRRRDPRADERQPLPLLGLSADPGGRARRGWGSGMRPFSYERAQSAQQAAQAAAEAPGARFLAGGTNLLDLMKLEIERPSRLI